MTDEVPTSDGDAQIARALERWLTTRLGSVTVELQGKPGSGFSAENIIFDATTVHRETSRWVLRRDSTQDLPYPEQAPGLGTGVALQHQVMTTLAGHVPVAATLGLEPDPMLLGAPFFVMAFVEGVVPVENPPCTAEGFYADGTPQLRSSMIRSGLAAMADVHRVPWRDVGLDSLSAGSDQPGAHRQLALWSQHLDLGLRGRSAAIFTDTIAALTASCPEPSRSPVLLWGDSRLGNIIWDPASGTPRCLTDFEGAAIGEPEIDLGWWLMADRWMHEGSAIERLAGEPNRDEQVTIYEQASGRMLAGLDWYELFAALRFAVTVVHVMNRWQDADLVPPDHTIWRENPATELIAMIAAEQGAS